MKKTLLTAAVLALSACTGPSSGPAPVVVLPPSGPGNTGPAPIMAPPPLPPPTDTAFYPSWSRGASIYEVNVRQYTPEGTFAALERHLPRLRGMGVDILWLMPVQPIGVAGRKGGLGSYYAIRDYTAINPEHGTEADFKRFM